VHFARNGMLKHPIPYVGIDAQANLTVGSGEKRLSFRSLENVSQTVVHYSMYVSRMRLDQSASEATTLTLARPLATRTDNVSHHVEENLALDQ